MLAAAAGLVPARVHQITAGADVLAGLLAGRYRGDRPRSLPGWGSRSGVQPGAVSARTRKNYLTPGPISAAQLSTFVHTIGNARLSNDPYQ